MDENAQKLQNSLNQTVPLNALDQHLEGLMLKFLQRRHRKKFKIDGDKVDMN